MNFLFSPYIKKIGFALVGLILLGSIVFLAWPGTIKRLDIISSNPNPLIRHFAPTWNSLKRIGDLPYLILYAARGTNIPVYEITLSKKDKETLFENLPDYPRVNAMWEEYKKTVKGEFRADDYYTNNAKIRIRGVSPNHWTLAKKSWQINLPEDKPLKERATLRLILPEDKGWIFNAMNAMRARELNLLSPEITYARLRINGVDMGIYQLVEGWEESMLEKNGRGLGPIFSNLNLNIRNVDLLRPDSLYIWENRFAKETYPTAIDALAYFLDLIANAPDDVFAEELPYIMDMDMYYRWLIITSLSGNFHQGNTANENWYFNPATGKLEPILFDTALNRIEGMLPLANNRLVNRSMHIPAFRQAFTVMLRAYLADQTYKNEALAFYDETFQNIKIDIINDTKKIQPTAEVLNQITAERDVIQHNYEELQRMLIETSSVSFTFADETYPVSQPFDKNRYQNSFLAHHTPLQKFLRAHPQFVLRDAHTLALPTGTQVFSSTTIIPEGYTVIFDAGAHLFFAPGASLFSYSPVYSNGTAASPVILRPLYPQKPWGVLAVINAPAASIFRHTRIEDGKDATFAGLYFSGSLSMRSSDLEFYDGYVARSHADDGIHVYRSKAHIARSAFENTSADSLDIDFAKDGSIFEKNTFHETGKGGDGMDLSFSNVAVRENIVMGCGDKGVSVGEASHPLIEKNIFIGCAYGIAVKDKSEAVVRDSFFLANKIGIGIYRKKPHFIEGGRITMSGSVLWENETPVSTDEFSTAEGIPIQQTSQLAEWKQKLPAPVFTYLETLLAKREKAKKQKP